ncbi:hypothetical protein BA062_25640 [Prauserella flavalba]|uniref:Uncharacterized protein n=1 Tax=Prauserella flavalba TaxID=1477506 RepID=A0A318LLU1_9PSEU|nr:hypothetical protein BA062_25640 [Prauserella flavalba]
MCSDNSTRSGPPQRCEPGRKVRQPRAAGTSTSAIQALKIRRESKRAKVRSSCQPVGALCPGSLRSTSPPHTRKGMPARCSASVPMRGCSASSRRVGWCSQASVVAVIRVPNSSSVWLCAARASSAAVRKRATSAAVSRFGRWVNPRSRK